MPRKDHRIAISPATYERLLQLAKEENTTVPLLVERIIGLAG
jgi:hypothetical protein